MITQGTSSCYAFWYFDKTQQRSFFNENGNADEFGTALPQEQKFNMNENAFYDDIHGLAKELGIDWAKAEHLDNFIVKQLATSEELSDKSPQLEQHNHQKTKHEKSNRKPWWKLW